jgi:uncharacterized protein (TIGR03083 family)
VTQPVSQANAGTTAACEVSTIPPIERPESVELASNEAASMVEQLSGLEALDWTRPTDCPLWDVRAVAGHVVGMAQTFSGLRRFASTMRAGGKAAGDGMFVDGLTAVQVATNAALTTAALVDELARLGPLQAQWRGGRRLMRRIPLKQEMRNGGVETWKLGYLLDIVLTRDSWMHRVDIARATGRPMKLTPAHDGRIVADAVAEWARRHGKPFSLELTGPAGGRFVGGGGGGEQITLDAVEFCRILSGRGTGEGLLGQEVPF